MHSFRECAEDGMELKMHLYLLIGQSNMAGRDQEAGPEDKTPHPRVFSLNKDNQLEPAVEPVQFDKPSIVGVGPGLSFGKFMADSDESIQVGLIPSAFGGTSIREWHKGADLYEAAVRRAMIARNDGVLKGILWHQGETDTQVKEDAEAHGDRLVQMIDDLRTDLQMPGVPVVIGELGRFLEYCAPFPSFVPKPEFVRTINEGLAGIPARVDNCAFVSSVGLESMGDEVHFSAESQREWGRRYGRKMLSLQGVAT